ncbi:MAG: phage major capsid protein [Deltaproteobacteria bacterium]|nr:phage major capsid protein [Deltaproteobacteria bacterium]
MNIAQKITAKREHLVSIKDALTILKALSEDGEDSFEYSDDQITEMTTLSEESETTIKSIESLEKMETALAAKAEPVRTHMGHNAPAAKKDVPMDLMTKSAVCSLLGFVQSKSAEQVASEIYKGEMDTINAYTKGVAIHKTAVMGADTTTATWAAELVRQQYAEFMDLLQPVSVFARLSAMGITVDLTNGPVTFPSRTNAANASGSWVGEQGVIPLGKLSLASKTMSPTKLAVIMAMSREIISQSVPQIEGIVRQAIIDDTAITLDNNFLDASAAVAGVRPAGILAGLGAIAPAGGGTVANIIADIKSVIAPMLSANMGAKPVLLMNSNTLLTLASLPSSVGTFVFRDEITGSGTLLGIPVVTSTTIPATMLIGLDAAALGYGMGAPEFATSESATLTMANADGTAPTQATDGAGGLGTAGEVKPDGGISVVGGADSGAATAGYQAQSMFQTYQLALRMVLPANWMAVRVGGIGHIAALPW